VAVAAWLVQLGAATGGVQRWSITQGVEMGRPSLLELEFEVTAAGASKVRLGGSVVRIGEGVLYA
jgi:trans-2,3-dihydro-3-hydroxyanthranilate isomerase